MFDRIIRGTVSSGFLILAFGALLSEWLTLYGIFCRTARRGQILSPAPVLYCADICI